jgi:hypothetical protein
MESSGHAAPYGLGHLDALEAEAVFIVRQAAAELLGSAED